MTDIITPLNDMLKTGELNQDKYYEVMTNGDYGRKLLFREVIRNNNHTLINNMHKKKYIFVPLFGDLMDFPENITGFDMGAGNFINNLWLTCDGYLNLGGDLDLILSQLSEKNVQKEFKYKKEIEMANNYLYSVQIADHSQVRSLIEDTNNANRFITIPICLYASYINMSLFERNSGHIGLYVIDKYTLKAYFFDPNGRPSYFNDIKKAFKSIGDEQREELDETDRIRLPRNAFDDINMTFEEYAFLTERHLKSHDTIIHNILKSYTKKVSLNIEYETSENFYKFVPNSNMLTASFDKGSCVTWTLIMDNLIHKNEQLTYNEIIKKLCQLPLIDSQRICYQYQNGLYDIMQSDSLIKTKMK